MGDDSALLLTPFLPLNDFAAACRTSRTKVYALIRQGRVSAVKHGKSTLIKETPGWFLNTLPRFMPATMKAGPGRGNRGPMSVPAQLSATI
jgi:hypothetical protein